MPIPIHSRMPGWHLEWHFVLLAYRCSSPCLWTSSSDSLQRAPVNTSKHNQHFSHVYSQLCHTNCTAMGMLICNMHYCRLAIQSTSKVYSTAVKLWPQIFAWLPFIWILEFMLMTSLCATQSFHMLQHSAPVQRSNTFALPSSRNCSNAVYRNFTTHILITHNPSVKNVPKNVL